MPAAELLKQADFAARMGWDKSTVTRMKQAGRVVMVDEVIDVKKSLSILEKEGRLVMDGGQVKVAASLEMLKQAGRLIWKGGLVDVEASLARIKETGGMRFDVAERHAAQRDGNGAGKVGTGGTAGAGEGQEQGGGTITQTAPDAAIGERRVDAQARKESALADMAEMEVAQKRGELIPKADVDAALRSFAASVRARLDVLPDQLAPLVSPVTDMDEIHALLAEHCRSILSAVADDMGRAATAAGQGGA
jgi:hypothetical protein